MSKYITIPYIDNYLINKYGKIINSNTLKELYVDNKGRVEIDGIKLYVSDLFINTFFGIIDMERFYLYGKDDISMINCNSVGYIVNDEMIESNNVIILDGFYFRRIYSTKYFVSDSGIIYDSQYEKIKSYSYTDCRYPKCFVGRNRSIHEIVYSTWIKNLEIMGMEYTIDHIDGRKYNNHYSNLELVPHHENVLRSFIINTRNSDWAKDIHNICKLMENRTSIEEIAKSIGYESNEELNSSELQLLLNDIESKRRWLSISSQYNIDPSYYVKQMSTKRNPLSENDIDKILKLYSEGKTQKQISKMMNINRKRLNSIIYDKTSHQHIRSKYTYEKAYKRNLLDDKTVHSIFNMLSNGHMSSDIIKHFENDKRINRDLITRMRNGKAYKKIGELYDLSRMYLKTKFSEDDIHDICKLLESGKSISHIAKEYNVGFHAIGGIYYGETWRHISQKYKMKYNKEGVASS